MTKQIVRYDMDVTDDFDCESCRYEMVPSPDGVFVRYDDIKHLLAVEPTEELPCPKRSDGYHDFRHEVCDCGASRGNTVENRG